jgi:hypothetical protein
MKYRHAAIVGFSSGFSCRYCKAFCVFVLFGRSRGSTLLRKDLNRAIFETEVVINDSMVIAKKIRNNALRKASACFAY